MSGIIGKNASRSSGVIGPAAGGIASLPQTPRLSWVDS